MDITKTTEPKSDQLNFDHVATSDITITITEVKAGGLEQPVELHNAEYPGRPYKPGKSMRRVLIAAWGPEASAYVGRRIRLYGDPTIRFGSDAVGGIRIRAMSDIPAPLTVSLTVTRGKRAPFTVEPLPETPDPVTAALEQIAKAGSMGELKAAWDNAGKRGVATNATVIAAKDQRKTELEGDQK